MASTHFTAPVQYTAEAEAQLANAENTSLASKQYVINTWAGGGVPIDTTYFVVTTGEPEQTIDGSLTVTNTLNAPTLDAGTANNHLRVDSNSIFTESSQSGDYAKIEQTFEKIKSQVHNSFEQVTHSVEIDSTNSLQGISIESKSTNSGTSGLLYTRVGEALIQSSNPQSNITQAIDVNPNRILISGTPAAEVQVNGVIRAGNAGAQSDSNTLTRKDYVDAKIASSLSDVVVKDPIGSLTQVINGQLVADRFTAYHGILPSGPLNACITDTGNRSRLVYIPDGPETSFIMGDASSLQIISSPILVNNTLSVNGSVQSSVAPVNDNSLTNKHYVDSTVSGSGTNYVKKTGETLQRIFGDVITEGKLIATSGFYPSGISSGLLRDNATLPRLADIRDGPDTFFIMRDVKNNQVQSINTPLDFFGDISVDGGVIGKLLQTDQKTSTVLIDGQVQVTQDPFTPNALTNKQYVDTAISGTVLKNPGSGVVQIISGTGVALTGSIAASSGTLQNVVSNDKSITNKIYVDTAIANAISDNVVVKNPTGGALQTINGPLTTTGTINCPSMYAGTVGTNVLAVNSSTTSIASILSGQAANFEQSHSKIDQSVTDTIGDYKHSISLNSSTDEGVFVASHSALYDSEMNIRPNQTDFKTSSNGGDIYQQIRVLPDQVRFMGAPSNVVMDDDLSIGGDLGIAGTARSGAPSGGDPSSNILTRKDYVDSVVSGIGTNYVKKTGETSQTIEGDVNLTTGLLVQTKPMKIPLHTPASFMAQATYNGQMAYLPAYNTLGFIDSEAYIVPIPRLTFYSNYYNFGDTFNISGSNYYFQLIPTTPMQPLHLSVVEFITTATSSFHVSINLYTLSRTGFNIIGIGYTLSVIQNPDSSFPWLRTVLINGSSDVDGGFKRVVLDPPITFKPAADQYYFLTFKVVEDTVVNVFSRSMGNVNFVYQYADNNAFNGEDATRTAVATARTTIFPFLSIY